MLGKLTLGLMLIFIGSVCSASLTETLPETLNKLKDQFVEEAKKKLDEIKAIKTQKRSSLSLDDIATAGVNGNPDIVDGLGSSLGNGADLFTSLFDVFNQQFVGRFFGIIQDQLKNQQLLQQMQQNGILSKRALEVNDLDKLKDTFDLKLEDMFKNSKGLDQLGNGMLDKYLGLAKDFTGKLKDITVDLVHSIQPNENKN